MGEYIKEFDIWNKEKKELHMSEEIEIYPKPRHIWYAKFGVNIGSESDGKAEFLRPVLVLSKIGSLYWVVPLTSKFKENIFHHTLESVKFEKIEYSLIMLSQARIIDKKRFQERIGKMVSKEEFSEIQKKMKSLYFPSISS